MTLSALRSLHNIIGEALDDIERIYASHGERPPSNVGATVDGLSAECTRLDRESIPSTAELETPQKSYAYVSPPPSPSVSTGQPYVFPASLNITGSGLHIPVDFPSLDLPYDSASLSENLALHPAVVCAANRIVAAAGQLSATVQTPFLSLCDASMGYHLPSCMRILEASHTVEILRPAGLHGLHVKQISQSNGIEQSKLAHILRLLATHHILRETSPDVFALNRISSIIDTGKTVEELQQFQDLGQPEKKFENTNGIAAFVGLCTDEIYKSSAYLTEAYYLSTSKSLKEGREPTRAPFSFAFGTLESNTGFFGWLEGQNEHSPTFHRVNKVEVSQAALYPPAPGLLRSGNPDTPNHSVPNNHRKLKSQTNAKLLTQVANASTIVNPNKFRLERFGKAMSGTGSWEGPGAIFNGFDWQSLPRGSVVVDVGGGIGSTSMLLASAFSDDQGLGLKFIIQDRPIVVEMGEKAWRVKCPHLLDTNAAVFQVHDFFIRQPVRDAAVFLLRVVLHDWPDDFARRILIQLREAAKPDTRLLLGDFILPLACTDDVNNSSGLEDIEGAERMLAPAPLLPNLGKASANAYWMDLTMQVMFNAQERTLRDIVTLTLSAGWKVIKVTKTPPGSLFGYIVAIPEPIELSRQVDTRNASIFYDKIGSSPEIDNNIGEKPLLGDQLNKGEMEMIERAISRCGTPTFGSRMELPSVEEELARFGRGTIRSKLPGLNGKTLTHPMIKVGALRPVVSLPLQGKKKRPSPLTLSQLSPSISSSPSPSLTSRILASPRPTKGTQSPTTSNIRRRMSLAHLSQPVPEHDIPPLPSPYGNQHPPSPMSPRHPHGPLSRRSSHAQLFYLSQSQLSPVPSMIPIRQVQDLSPPAPRPSISSIAPGRSPGIIRRSSYTQLPSLSTQRKRATSTIGPSAANHPVDGILRPPLHLGMDLGGKVLRFEQDNLDPCPTPGTSSRSSPTGNGERSVLAAAARIDGKLFTRAKER